MGSSSVQFFPRLIGEERERRLRLFRVLLVVQLVTMLLVAGSTLWDVLSTPYTIAYVVAVAVLLLVAIGGYFMARRGAFYAGALTLIASTLLLPVPFLLFYGTRGASSYLFVWPIMAAAILLEPALLFTTTALAGLGYSAISVLELYRVGGFPVYMPEIYAPWHAVGSPGVVGYYVAEVVSVSLFYLAVAVFSHIALRSLRQEVQLTRDQAGQLLRYRAELEDQVSARTAELRQTTERLQGSLALLREMGSPVLPLLRGILLVPLVGTLDSERMRLVMENVLRGIAGQRARVVILDITGVTMVDTAVANALLQTAHGARLLGATPVLVGIRADVAQTIMGLGVDLQGIDIRAGLEGGLSYALELVGGEIRWPQPGGGGERAAAGGGAQEGR